MEFDNIELDVVEGIATITLSRPEWLDAFTRRDKTCSTPSTAPMQTMRFGS